MIPSITLIVLTAFITQTFSSSPLSIEVPIQFKHQNYIEIKFGDTSKEKLISLDLGKHYTVFVDQYYTSNTNKDMGNNVITFKNQQYTVKELSDKVTLIEVKQDGINKIYHSINNFTFYLEKENEFIGEWACFGFIGLALKFKNIQYSLVHQYYTNKLISQPAFAISKSTSKFILGPLPSTYTNERTHSFCEPNLNITEWHCLLGTITIDNDNGNKTQTQTYTHDKSSSSITVVKFTNGISTVPKDFFDMIVNVALKKEIEGKICSAGKNQDDWMVQCNKKAIETKATITINIGDYSYRIPFKSFFECDDVCLLRIQSRDDNNDSEWTLGAMFYSHITAQFDYDTHRVHFYSNKEFVEVKEIGGNTVKGYLEKILMIAALSIVGFGIIAIAFRNKDQE